MDKRSSELKWLTPAQRLTRVILEACTGKWGPAWVLLSSSDREKILAHEFMALLASQAPSGDPVLDMYCETARNLFLYGEA